MDSILITRRDNIAVVVKLHVMKYSSYNYLLILTIGIFRLIFAMTQLCCSALYQSKITRKKLLTGITFCAKSKVYRLIFRLSLIPTVCPSVIRVDLPSTSSSKPLFLKMHWRGFSHIFIVYFTKQVLRPSDYVSKLSKPVCLESWEDLGFLDSFSKDRQ